MVQPPEDEEVAGSNSVNQKQMYEALTADMGRLIAEQLEAIKLELQRGGRQDQSDNQRRRARSRAPERGRDRQRQQIDEDAASYYSQNGSSSHGSHRSRRREREARVQQDNLGGLKLKIPSFHGKNDPDAYLEWEKKIELVFDLQRCTEANRVKLAATEFYDYASSWWDQLVTARRRNREFPVDSWLEMKTIMRKRFVPSHYHRELHQKLRRLTQGNRSVEEYYQELETLLIRADVYEDREATMSRFLGGLNREIQDRLEMQHYVEIEEMLHKAILIEQQIKRKSSHSRSSYGAGASSTKPSYQGDEKQIAKPKTEPEPYPAKQDYKRKVEATTSTGRDVRCFKCQGKGHFAKECPNQRIMVLLDNGEIEEEEKPSESSEEHEVVAVKGDLLVIQRALNVHIKTDEHEQRRNLFHSRCHVQGKVCSVIIDGGSCTNVASETMVKKLQMTVTKHPKPYNLQWLNNEEMEVSNQVSVPITIGKYQDEVLCDVLPMEASHILLGRPWQYDRRALHDGFNNRYSFDYEGKKITLVPMSPQEIYQDQLLLKHKGKQVVSETSNSHYNKNKKCLLVDLQQTPLSLTNHASELSNPSEEPFPLQQSKARIKGDNPKEPSPKDRSIHNFWSSKKKFDQSILQQIDRSSCKHENYLVRLRGELEQQLFIKSNSFDQQIGPLGASGRSKNHQDSYLPLEATPLFEPVKAEQKTQINDQITDGELEANGGRVLNQTKINLMPISNRPIQIPEQTTNKAYEKSLQGKYLLNFNFNDYNLVFSLADFSDLRSNPFQVGEDDMILSSNKEGELEPDKKHEAYGGLLATKRAKAYKIKEGIGVTQVQHHSREIKPFYEHQQMD